MENLLFFGVLAFLHRRPCIVRIIRSRYYNITLTLKLVSERRKIFGFISQLASAFFEFGTVQL